MLSPAEYKQDALTTLLFRLPAELRQQIYDLLVPQDDILLLPQTGGWYHEPERQLPDCRPFLWLATSPSIFLDAAPQFYSVKPIYFHIDAFTPDDRLSLNDALTSHVQTAYPQDAEWTLNVIRSRLLKKLVLEVHNATISEELLALLPRFAAYSSQFRQFTALEELYIGGRPDCGFIQARNELRQSARDLKLMSNLFRSPERRESTIRRVWSLRCMCRAVRDIRRDVRPECKLEWYVPGIDFHKLTHGPFGRTYERFHAEEERAVTETVVGLLENLCTFICERSDEQLEELLSEKSRQLPTKSVQ